MTAVGSSSGVLAREGLRRANLLRDSADVARLLSIAFPPGETRLPMALLGEFKTAADLYPLAWFVGAVNADVRNAYAGFVWEHEGRIVGNVNVATIENKRGVWVISNVAVHPRARRQGIARRLLRAAVQFIKEHYGRLAVLDVRARNRSAYDLYVSDGFHLLDGVVEWERVLSQPLPAAPLPWGRWRSLGGDDSARMAALVSECLPPLARRVSDPDYRAYAVGPWSGAAEWLGRVLSAQPARRAVIEREGALLAAVRVEYSRVGPDSSLGLLVHPAVQLELAAPVARAGLAMLPLSPWRRVNARVLVSHTAVVEALRGLGFIESDAMHRLYLPLQSDWEA